MDYFNDRFGRVFDRVSGGMPGGETDIPDYMPREGLVYYDRLVNERERAPTGQRYSERHPGDGQAPNDELLFTVMGGKRCLYKENPNNGLSFDIYDSPKEMTDYSWGCWVYDAVGTCGNQQVMSLFNAEMTESNYLSFNGSNNRLVINHRDMVNNSTITYTYYNKGSIVGEWRFIYGWHGSGWFGPRMPPLNDGNNLASAQDQRIVMASARLMPWPSCYGAAIRGAFIYNRVITAAEGMAIYNGSKDET